ncbi:MAG TPA: M23 family metallopeptidase [Spirochaetota bacterium]|nr:M23 family metallopeptidase [Spirochaetota bacterium]
MTKSINLSVTIAIIVVSLLSVSFQLPVQNGTIHSTFGEPRSDHFHNGVDISSIDKKVYPVKDGKLIFLWDKSLFPLEQYPGVGNYCILEHNKQEKSLYVHLDNGISMSDNYTAGDSFAIMGNTGRSYGTHLHFGIIKNGRISVNPFVVLPHVDDVKTPVIEAIYIKVEDKYTNIHEGSNIRLTKHHPIAIQCFDSVKKNERCGIYKLKVIVNNDIVANYKFDSIVLNNKNKLTIGGFAFENLYDAKGNYLVSSINYKQGINTINVIAEDFAGNQTSKSISFMVVLDFK